MGHRVLKNRLLISAMVGAALVAAAAPAAAETADDHFLQRLADIGLDWPPEHHVAVINLGHHICIDRLTGWSADRIANDIHPTMSQEGFTFEHVQAIIAAAEDTYCSYDDGAPGAPGIGD